MGSSISSTSSDRRNNAFRRSQRKSITGACSNIDKLIKSIKKFHGTEDSEEYKNLKIKIIQIERNLQEKTAEVQPQFKALHNITKDKIKSAYDLLEQRTKDNVNETSQKGNRIISNGENGMNNHPEKIEEPKRENEKEISEPTTPIHSPNNQNKRNSLIMRLSKITSGKRDSKNSNSSSADAEIRETTVELHKSPEATRKSIMKYGVPVLPSPTSNGAGGGRQRLVSFNTPDDVETTLEKREKRLKIIKQDVANLEIRISEFVGKKDGKHYNNLKMALTKLVEELEEIDEEELLDQVVMCHNYIKSCFTFLESKAVEADDIDDDVFTNYTDSKIYGSTHDLLEGHSVRTTAI